MAIKKVKLPDNTTVELNDARVDVSSPSNGQVLAYNSTSQKFENQSISTGGGDVYYGDGVGGGEAATILSGVTMNGSPVTVTDGVANLGTVITSHQSIKTVNNTTMTGTGNVSVQATLVSGTNIKTINNESILGSGNLSVSGLPSVSSSDNGKVLEVNNGTWTAVKPVTIYSGSSAPSSGTGSNGDIYIQTES